MPHDILEQLGLSVNEAKIYEALIDLKEASIAKIAVQCNIHRRNVYDAIKRLVQKNLVFSILERKENTYAPVDPDALMDMVREQEKALMGVLSTLREKYYGRQKAQEAFIYRGLEGFKNYMRDILHVGKDVYFIGGTLAWFDPRLDNFRVTFFEEARKKSIAFHAIFDSEVKEKGQEELKEFRTRPKFFPKSYSTEAIFVIFGDYVVMYAGVYFKRFADDITFYILRDKDLAESYRTWFQFMYDFCPS